MEQLRSGVSADSGGTCRTVDVLASDAVLQRCVNGAETEWWFDVPDTSGAGVWVLSAIVGPDHGVSGGQGLAAVAEVATTIWGP